MNISVQKEPLEQSARETCIIEDNYRGAFCDIKIPKREPSVDLFS